MPGPSRTLTFVSILAVPRSGRSLQATLPTAGPLVGVACSSAAVLTLEVVLTRVFAVTQFYHFAFLTVSVALLGFGASGSALTAIPRLGRGGPRRWALLGLAQAVSTVVAYLIINSIPFDSYSIAWDRRQIGYLAVYYLALAVPFFFGGAVIGALLAGWDQPVPILSRRVYAASLIGSGLGALAALVGVDWFGGVGTVMMSAFLAVCGAVAFAVVRPEGRVVATTVLGVVAAVLAVLTVATPEFLDLRLSQYKELSAALLYPDAEVISTSWDSGARVDHLRSEGVRSLPGLSFTYPGGPPPQDGLAFDGDDLNPIPLIDAAGADFVPYLLSSLPYALRPGSRAMVLEPRGGLEVLVAVASGAERVTAVEPSRSAVDAARGTGGHVYDDPRVNVVVEEPRAYVERVDERFDIVDLALTSPYRPVTSGAYSLAEDYTLTTEAFERYLDQLDEGGIVAVMRWVQVPASEETRLVALAAEAVRERGGDPVQAVVALRGYSTALVLVAPDTSQMADLSAIWEFAAARRFDIIAAPGLTPEESNRFNVVPDDDYFILAAGLLAAADPAEVYGTAQFDISPPRDDHPFFGHYFKWSQAGDVLDGLGKSWQPFGGAGYLVLVALLALSALGALFLIVVPLLLARLVRSSTAGLREPGHRLWTVGYFGLLGMGFLLVEIPLVQRYILLIGRPTQALAVVLFGLLLASGLGSLASHRVAWRAGAVGIVVLTAATALLVPVMTDVLLRTPQAMRMVAGGVAIVPLGFFMGVMFPKGLVHLEQRAPHLVPWAWGVNGTVSVISAATAALLTLSFGFSAVLVLGAACYVGATLLARSGYQVGVNPG